MPATEISRFTLYRDPNTADDPEFVHIEDIGARSRLYEWQITPHRHTGMFQIVFVREGGATVRLDERTAELKAPAAVTVPSGVVHSFVFEPETLGHVVTVSQVLLVDARYRRSRKLLDPLYRAPLTLDFSDAPDQRDIVARTLEQMHAEFLWPQLGRSSMFEWQLRILLMTLRRQLERISAPQSEPGSRSETFARLRELIEDQYRQHWSIADYAEALGISRVQLNRLARSFADKSVLDLIQDRLLLEAQRHLTYTSASAAEIAYELGFQDPAYFSRVFKRRTGATPGEFRRSSRAATTPEPAREAAETR